MAVLDATDPLWVVQLKERSKYEEYFKSLNPDNGIITGEQAKGFFLQSQLPPNILGQIWALSDTDSDGRMDINEFSVACKLINLKLRGFQIPTVLPPALKNITTQYPISGSSGLPAINNSVLPQAVPSVPMPQTTQSTLGNQSLVGNKAGIPTTTVTPLLPVNSMATTVPVMQSSLMGSSQITQVVEVPQPRVTQALPPNQPSNFSLPLIGNQGIPPQVMDPVMTQIPNIVSQVSSVIPQVPPVVSQPTTGIPQPSQSNSTPVVSQIMPNTQPGTPVESNKIIERGASVDSLSSAVGSPISEWAVPHQSKLKYTQLFNTTDRTRTGYLSGPQAKPLLIQTKLPQSVLAQIWVLADSDSDGQINCEEFVLAMHLCDIVKEGRPVPPTLPPELVPPAQRRKRGSSFSVSEDKSDVTAVQNNVTFEDKRKENFDKGQAELERRRAVLLEAQRKEQEERERKEEEERQKREALRAEQEARRQQELQKQLQKQRELELEQEEQRKRASEQREAARKELERQRQQEWEKARTQELEAQRMKEQNDVLKLKAKNQALAIELATLTGKVKELSVKITETRSGVSAAKATIDGMRMTRDTHMAEMATLKNKLKEQNQRLLLLTQEKARLEARNKVGPVSNSVTTEQVILAFNNKQITIKHLNEKLADLQNDVKTKREDVENNNLQLKDLKNQLANLVNDCETLYATYSVKRDSILELKAANSSSSWGVSSSSWQTSTNLWTSGSAPSWDTPSSNTSAGSSSKRYRALYKFESRNPDELSFQPGDIIIVPDSQNLEPGWLAGEFKGMTGWFPEAYVELIDTADTSGSNEMTNNHGKQPLEGILELPENGTQKVNAEGEPELYVSVYRYDVTEPGDLSFEQGETITVIKKEGAWWTGTIGDRTGLFPSNYVEKVVSKNESEGPSEAPLAENTTAVEDDSVFVSNQLDDTKREPSKSPLPTSATVSGRETPADFEHTKPVTPDFAAITAAQTKIIKKGEVATVIAPYQATSSEQLSLARGQLVCIRKKTTTGWWEGELQAKGKKKQVGWFPASYVKLMASRRLSQTTPDIESEQNIEKVVAMFPYKALNEDELSFEKDDIITVLVREEAAWWRGELKGAVGLFPSNYVMPVDRQLQKLSPEEKLRQEAIHELLESERAYTTDMSLVRQVFEKPLSKSGLITREQLQMIFLNWREILKGNHALLKLLEERKQQSIDGIIECVGDILCDNLPRMGAYIRFCSCQLNAGALLQQLTDSSPAFRELCKQCQRDSRTQGLPLSTFLVKPMQRITKYPLLISKVLEHTATNHPDRAHLEEALLRAEKLCSQVNEGVRENENSERLEWLQTHVVLDGLQEPIVFNSVTNSLGRRKFLHYGVLTKARSGRELVGFLLSDCLILAQPLKALINGQFTMDRATATDLKLYKKPLLTKEITAVKSSDSERGFSVVTPKGHLNFFTGSPTETSQWIKHITAAHEKTENVTYTPHLSRILRSDDGCSAGRLLVEVVEGYNLEPKSCFCEVRLNNQVQYTPALGPSHKWNSSMQFLIQSVERDTLCVAVLVKYEFKPDDLLDRGEVRVNEILQQTRTGGPVLRKLTFHQLRTIEVLLKLDLVLFNVR